MIDRYVRITYRAKVTVSKNQKSITKNSICFKKLEKNAKIIKFDFMNMINIYFNEGTLNHVIPQY